MSVLLAGGLPMGIAGIEKNAMNVRNSTGELFLIRDLLDKQIVDRRHEPMGRVDGLMLGLYREGAPQLLCLESGITVSATRIGRRMGRWARAAARRWGLSRGRPMRIMWPAVKRIGIETEVDLKADESRALAWEYWLLEHFVRHVPSLKPEEKDSHRGADGKASDADKNDALMGAPEERRKNPPIIRRVRVQRLLGREVTDRNGQKAGHIEEIRAQVRDGQCRIDSFDLGRKGLMERLSVPGASLALMRLLGAHRSAAGAGFRIPWHQLDLEDARHPRLLCTLAELEAMQPKPASR
jgi:sporulation protein YlmC with PRC-barrel domain